MKAARNGVKRVNLGKESARDLCFPLTCRNARKRKYAVCTLLTEALQIFMTNKNILQHHVTVVLHNNFNSFLIMGQKYPIAGEVFYALNVSMATIVFVSLESFIYILSIY